VSGPRECPVCGAAPTTADDLVDHLAGQHPPRLVIEYLVERLDRAERALGVATAHEVARAERADEKMLAVVRRCPGLPLREITPRLHGPADAETARRLERSGRLTSWCPRHTDGLCPRGGRRRRRCERVLAVAPAPRPYARVPL
jgi:hypothetical protein